MLISSFGNLNKFWILIFCLGSILTIQLNAQPRKNKIASQPRKQVTVKFPNTVAGETALFNEINQIEAAAGEFVTDEDLSNAERNAQRNSDAASRAELKKLTETSEAQKPTTEKVRQLRWELVKRPVHFDKAKLANAYYLLLYDVQYNPHLTDAQLGEIITGLITYKQYLKFEVNSRIASTLVLNKKYHPKSAFNDQAEKYARIAISETEEQIRNLSEKEVSEKALPMRAEVLNLLGSVLFAEGKMTEAEAALIKARNLLPEKTENLRLRRISINNNINLAKLYTQNKEFEKAEQHYLNAAVRFPNEWMNFEDLYKARNNEKTEGFEDYFKQVSEKISQNLRQQITSERLADPPNAVPFELKTIEGNNVSFSGLKGKIIVINLWGTWCAPCVRELPELQQLYKRYENDKEVAIITMDVEDELETVKKFIADKKYEFPVLMADSYKENMKFFGAITFPTTLFIGKRGKIEYLKIGNSPKLFEEFNWRIEALKEE